MTKLFLLPGGLICDAVGLIEDSDNRQILRMFLNTLIGNGDELRLGGMIGWLQRNDQLAVCS
jgi:hypothetical protein